MGRGFELDLKLGLTWIVKRKRPAFRSVMQLSSATLIKRKGPFYMMANRVAFLYGAKCWARRSD